jgi:hypothetical protein
VPGGFAKQAASGNFTLVELTTPAIIHEWTTKPGKRIFQRFGANFRQTICGPGGPYQQFGGKNEPVTSASAIVILVSGAGAIIPLYFVPLLALCAMVVVKTGLKTFCET